MSAENPQATMQSLPTTPRTRLTVTRGSSVQRKRQILLIFLMFSTAIIGGILLFVGLPMTCYSYDYCDYRRRSYIISGSCLLVSAVIFHVCAIVQYSRMRTTIGLDQSSSAQQPVSVSPGYPGQPVVAFPTVPTQYPPPYHPPTGPFPYPFSPADNQYPLPADFTANPHPTESYLQEVTKPPPYSP